MTSIAVTCYRWFDNSVIKLKYNNHVQVTYSSKYNVGTPSKWTAVLFFALVQILHFLRCLSSGLTI